MNGSDLGDYNVLAILVAAAANVGIGMVWYAPPVLGARWQQMTGVTKPSPQAFAIWVVCALLISFTLAYLFRNMGVNSLEGGFRWGSTLGGTLVLAAMAPGYAFGRKSLHLFLIEGGNVLVAVTVTGMILGAWR